MKGIWIGNDDVLALRKGKEYEILGIDEGFDAYVVMDETGAKVKHFFLLLELSDISHLEFIEKSQK